ncbi:UNVERIFIED_CONTAM: hypothetical protein PYX00_010352 [Menopon gallinae]|uniref:Transmembrane protein 222 n=1 Tax=Menopon gallinae TaxID=328185 RepID=A0AAW2HFD3_9NEOP
MGDGESVKYPSNRKMDENPYPGVEHRVNHEAKRYPFCIVWTPIPFLTWLFPFIGHMGIGTSIGIIRDFAGPYFVSTDNMAFGKPTKYWQLSPANARGGTEGWDRAVSEASEEYKSRNHNLCIDNCHSHVAMALNLMAYKGSTSWNMVKLCFLMMIHGRYVGISGILKTWLPFILLLVIIGVVVCITNFKI